VILIGIITELLPLAKKTLLLLH